MFATGNKKMLNMLILEILEQYSDENHHLSQQEILRLLKLNYGMECDRRSVKNNIIMLKELGYDIDMTSGYFLVGRRFDDAELRLLIDSVLFSKNISSRQAKNLIDKLKSFGNRYFQAKVNHISNLPELHHSDNKQVLYVLDALNDAIEMRKKVNFIYNSYGTDFKLHPRKEEKYIVNPYQIVANNGRYYLIGNYEKYDNISHYRLDRMTSVSILDDDRKEIDAVDKDFSLPEHMADHIYMFGGDSIKVQMRVKKHLMNELVDWFGKDFRIEKEFDDDIVIVVKCNEQAMRFWALQYGLYVEVLKPKTLRENIRHDISIITKKYEN